MKRPPAARPASSLARCGPPLVVVLLVLLCFSPVLHNDFVNWDDDVNFLDNPHYRGLSPVHLAWMFTTLHWGPYQPLSWLSHAVVYVVWGVNPAAYHAVNLLLHAGNAVLLYFLIEGLLRRAGGAAPSPGGTVDERNQSLDAAAGKMRPTRDERTEAFEVKGWMVLPQSWWHRIERLQAVLSRASSQRGRGEGEGARCRREPSTLAPSPSSSPARNRCAGEGSSQSLVVAATAGALFFALHPLRVEAVAWATERREVLAACFLLLSLLAYLHMHEGPKSNGRGPTAKVRPRWRRWYLVSLVCFALSLLSKASGMTLPVVLLILDVYPLRRLGDGTADRPDTRRAVLLEKLPYTVLAAAAAVTALVGQQHAEATVTLASHGVVQRLAQCAYGLMFYVWKTLLPFGLSPLYLLPRPLQPTEARFLAAATLCAAITAMLVYQRRAWPWALAAWMAYVVTVAPVLGLVQSGPQIVADRYSYLACLPWAVLVAAGVGWLERRRQHRWLTLALVAAALGGLGLRTFAQTRLWQDSLILWTQALAVEPDNYVAYAARGKARLARGDVDGALTDLDAALQRNPVYVAARVSRGNARQQKGALDAAVADFTAALQTRPGDAHTLVNRGNARQLQGDAAGALADYDAALRIDPHLAAAYYRRGNVHKARGALDAALADYTECLRLDPTFASAYNNRAIAREGKGDLQGAVSDYTAALRLVPNSGPFQRNVARARQLLAPPKM